MRRLTMWLVSASALAACSPAADKNAESRTGDTTSAAAPASAGPMAIVTVLYNQPKDTAAFEKYYASSHLPLVQANQQEIASAVVHRYGTLGHDPAAVFALLLKYAVSEDGALHAETVRNVRKREADFCGRRPE